MLLLYFVPKFQMSLGPFRLLQGPIYGVECTQCLRFKKNQTDWKEKIDKI